jgi:hypothetical protein
VVSTCTSFSTRMARLPSFRSRRRPAVNSLAGCAVKYQVAAWQGRSQRFSGSRARSRRRRPGRCASSYSFISFPPLCARFAILAHLWAYIPPCPVGPIKPPGLSRQGAL